MSRFRFLHAADLHLGSPFEGLAVKDRDIAERLAGATRDAFAELVRQAIEREVSFVVIAGDIYDGEWRDNTIGLFFNRELGHLDRAGIPVCLLKGNHDADSVVTKAISLPATVRQFDTKKPTTIRFDDLKIALHGQGFAERAATDNLALGYPSPVPGYFNIGVLHTSLTGRPPHANYAPCTVGDLKSRGYAYWALGHVHDFEIVAEDPHIVFPGNLQGRNARETGEKGAVIVTVEDGRVVDVERIFVDQARFATIVCDIADIASVPDLLLKVEKELQPLAATSQQRLHAIRLRLHGATPLRRMLVAGRSGLADEVQAACHRVDPDFWLEKLVLDLTDPAEAAGHKDGSVDLAPLMDAAMADDALRETAQALLAEIRSKMPIGAIGDGEDGAEVLDALLAEARDVALARAADGPPR